MKQEQEAYLDESVELLVTTNGQLQMTGCDTLHLLQQNRGRHKLQKVDLILMTALMTTGLTPHQCTQQCERRD